MPTRTTKRKPKRRKASARKRARRLRPASRPRVKDPPSSDEDFVLDGNGEEGSSGSTEQDDSEQEEDADEEEEEEEEDDGDKKSEVRNSDASVGRRRCASRVRSVLANATSHRPSRLKEDSSDEDFNADAERALDNNELSGNRSSANRPSTASRPRRQCGRENELNEDFDKDAQRSLEDNGIRREGQPANQASRSRRRHARRNSSDRDFDMDTEKAMEDDGTGEPANRTSWPARVRPRQRRQDSSDEDFEVDMERVLKNSGIANEGAVATRPMTRAMDSCQVSDLHVGRSGNILSDSFKHEGRGLTENSDALQQVTVLALGAGEPSLQTSNLQEARTTYVRRGSSAAKHTQINKRKGKEKVLEGGESAETLLFNANVSNADEAAAAAVVCGICLTEMVVAERGKLDCCDHFFCFGCIMEWAKVESRCPMCKQRFTTIAKSATGTCKRTRTIRIPLRDQVYIPPEDQDLPLEDPYADIVCMECHGTGDEGLLLLCDHCDSAAHTFCVGLGRSVPRGDWYCRDCQAFTGGISGSEDEAEEPVLASDDDEEEEEDESEDNETESRLRAIVASRIPTRQIRAQRRSTSTSRSPPLSSNVTDRLWQQLSSRRRGRPIAAPRPRLSQAARALLLRTLSELNQVPRASEAPQNGSARTVPQQRRLHERINEMRNNWGRIRNGDLQFDALRTGATGPIQPAASSNSNVAPIPPTPAVGNKTDVDAVERPESSTQGNKDLNKDVQRAWRMMDHAQNLSAGIGSSKSHQQRLGASPSSPALRQVTQPAENAASSATNNLPLARRNLAIPTCNVSSPPLGDGNAGTYKPGTTPSQVFTNLKHDLGKVTRPIVPSALSTLSGECRKEELPCSSKQALAAGTSPIDCNKDFRPAGGKHTVSFLENVSNGQKKVASTQGSKPELVKSSKHFERKDAGITHNLTENMNTQDNQDASAARENIAASSSSSPPHEGLKVHLTELVKKQTWPLYIAERLDKEQFKRIARAAVYLLLALCDPNNKSVSLSCVHFEDQGTNPVVKCCNKCLDEHVEKAVKNAKDKIIPS